MSKWIKYEGNLINLDSYREISKPFRNANNLSWTILFDHFSGTETLEFTSEKKAKDFHKMITKLLINDKDKV